MCDGVYGNYKYSRYNGMKNKTNVVFILDKSGSMDSVVGATIEGFNSYVSKLKEDKGSDYRFSLTLFDSSAERKYRSALLSEVAKLTRDNYRPDGSTALYDAACDTLTELGGEGCDKTLVAVMTDGEENASRRYTEVQFRDLVRALKGTGTVSFVFLGANQDAWGNASRWGFERQNVAFYNATPRGIGQVFTMMASNTASLSAQAENSTQKFFSQADQDELKNTQ